MQEGAVSAFTWGLVKKMICRREPAYLKLFHSKVLEKRVNQAVQYLTACKVCPLNCGVNRLQDKKGVCQTGRYAQVSSYGPHYGEEVPISGWRGSGTIFFSRCNLHCVFCQKADISQIGFGKEVSPENLAEIMLALQKTGCHNINLVSPSHVVPQILEALLLAVENGLCIPLVYNSGGYDSLETLYLLNGIIDIYMPDMKFADEKMAKKYSRIPNYPIINQKAIEEMYRQVGDLELESNGVAFRGLLVRHLVMPDNIAGSKEIIEFLVNRVSSDIYLNLMDQYYPAFQVAKFPEINRKIHKLEFFRIIEYAKSKGIYRFG